MATIEDLEEREIKDGEVVEGQTHDEQVMAIYDDLTKALELLKKAVCLFDYVSDKDLCHTVSKRERDAMSRLSDKLTKFVEETEESYGDES